MRITATIFVLEQTESTFRTKFEVNSLFDCSENNACMSDYYRQHYNRIH